MPSFKGTSEIIIQPFTNSAGYRFHFTTASTSSANDGFIPFSLTIASVTVTAKTSGGVEETTLVYDTTLTTPDVDLALSWPANGAGRYSLRFALTLSDGGVMEADFSRVRATDL